MIGFVQIRALIVAVIYFINGSHLKVSKLNNQTVVKGNVNLQFPV